jgi:hypothetical protein
MHGEGLAYCADIGGTEQCGEEIEGVEGLLRHLTKENQIIGGAVTPLADQIRLNQQITICYLRKDKRAPAVAYTCEVAHLPQHIPNSESQRGGPVGLEAQFGALASAVAATDRHAPATDRKEVRISKGGV